MIMAIITVMMGYQFLNITLILVIFKLHLIKLNKNIYLQKLG